MSGRTQMQAESRQREASDPRVSAFVSASAGSGKTKLLIDRLLRLLLGGVDPARVLCLTFTKAAAAEMRVRLQNRLGEWVGLDDAALDAKLDELEQPASKDVRDAARRLFARVLDLPGGMRIDTIHAFCQSLLRRFPLEARLSPHFQLVDDALGTLAMREARESMLADLTDDGDMRDLLDHVAGLTTLAQFGQRVADLRLDGGRLEALLAQESHVLRAAQRAALGVTAEHEHQVIAGAVVWDSDALHAAIRVVAEQGSPKAAENAVTMLGWLGCEAEDRAENFAHWHGLFHTKAGSPAALSRLVNEALEKKYGLRTHLAAEQQRLAAVQDHRVGIGIARVSHALLTLAAPVIAAYAARKDSAALLDYDDLIGLTTKLLVDPGAAWVLYKLDGGIDHLLLDEVQDTAPAQWEIAGALTREFFAGDGARDVHRTVFAVGDRKQSIFSFQGADPDQFDRWRTILGNRVAATGTPAKHVELDVSFRSTTPVLALVDAVFAHPTAASGVAEDGLAHIANRSEQAGRVELWPLAPRPVADPPEPWTVPDRNLGTVGAPQRLADALAEWIARSCGTVALSSHDRMMAPGDVLVLVRRRNEFARSLVRALKAHGVPVAGLDRLVLTDQPAVADLLALGDTLLLPGDSLSLACVLTSPLGGLTDDSLMALAASRTGSLWEALCRRASECADWRAAHDFVAALLNRVDFVSPHALLAEALGPLGGRARLLARLGAEAAEPIDELLNAAMIYAATNPPSLQGFLHWLRQSGAEVKREAEGAGNAVRIMTVHGAKGLQAPVVILPDTTALPPEEGPVVWADHGGLHVPLWSPRKEFRNTRIDALRDAARRKKMEEYNRLLYVALTRAEDRLIVCGWEPRKLNDASWYAMIREGFSLIGAEAAPFAAIDDPWSGDSLSLDSPQTTDPDHRRPAHAVSTIADLPEWAGHAPLWQPAPPLAEPALPSPLAPSRPDNAGLGTVPQAASPLSERNPAGQRFQRGKLVHALLQHLPDLPEPDRAAAATAWLSRPGIDDAGALVDEVMSILDHPLLAPLFGPHGRAEVPLTGLVNGPTGGIVIGGLVDRLAVLDHQVLIADYKTNRTAPANADAVPALYLRQMAAYRAVLAAIYPGRAVQCALVWTTGAVVMPLPDALLDRHAPGA